MVRLSEQIQKKNHQCEYSQWRQNQTEYACLK